MRCLDFTLYDKPQPQGSAKAFIVAGKARITSANPKMRPFRHSLTVLAKENARELGYSEPVFEKHEPVKVISHFGFVRPVSAKKSRTLPVVKPDLDKLARALLDALTGVAFADDAQVVELQVYKIYTPQDEVHVRVEALEV